MTTLDIADLEQIVSTLRREHEHLTGGRVRSKVGGFKRAIFLALRVVTYSIPITLALLLAGVLLVPALRGSVFVVVLGGWLIVALILLMPLTLLNLPLIITAWKQRRPIVSRNLLVPAFPSWQLKGRWVVAALTVVAAALAVLLPDDFGWFGFAVFLVVIVLPFMLLMLQSFLGLAKRSLSLTRSIEELETVLEAELETARRDSRTEIELPHEVAVKLANATDGILDSERLRSIDESVLIMPTQYSVSQSAGFREGLHAHAPKEQLEVLDRVQALAGEQHPEGASQDESAGRWIWPLADAGVEMVYEIADDARQVLVHEVRASGDAGGGIDGAG